jgi:hypothetical protein
VLEPGDRQGLPRHAVSVNDAIPSAISGKRRRDVVTTTVFYTIGMSFSDDSVVAAVRAALSTVEDPELRPVELVLAPPWSPEKMSDDANFLLGVYG